MADVPHTRLWVFVQELRNMGSWKWVVKCEPPLSIEQLANARYVVSDCLYLVNVTVTSIIVTLFCYYYISLCQPPQKRHAHYLAKLKLFLLSVHLELLPTCATSVQSVHPN